MSNGISKSLVLEGLDCPNCAAIIEEEVGGLSGVAAASMNFASKLLSIEIDSDENVESVLRLTGEIIKKHEPNVVVKEKALSRPDRKVLLMVGLGCANCAARIEKEVKAIGGVKSAVMDNKSNKLTIEVFNRREARGIIEQATKIAQETVSGIKVVEDSGCAGQADESKVPVSKVVRFAIGAGLFCAALMINPPYWVRFALFFAAYLLVGAEVVLKAIKNILKGKVFDENFLMSVATIGAFAIGEFPEGVAVMLFYQVGEFFQHVAVNRSRKSIGALMDIRPDFANLKVGGDIKKVSPDEVEVGEIIVVKPGEKIALDGRVLEGRSMLDTSALTGESMPREVEAGQEVLSGSINQNGLLTVEVTKEFGQSTVSRILDLVQNAGSKKAPTENFITKFSRYYTPVVVFGALALAVLPPLLLPGASFGDWLNRALVFLVVSCPCALVVSIPLGFFGGIGGASKNGILVKGSNYLEALNNVDTVVFDKTGTLTKGVFNVTKVFSVAAGNESALLEYAAFAECYSNHPIALSIQKAYGREINKSEIESYDEISGHGIKVKVRGKEILAGNDKLMAREKVEFKQAEEAGTVTYLAVDGSYAGYLLISDELKPDARQAMQELKKAGVRKLVMLTGDNKAVGERIASGLGLDEVHAELLPDQKVEKLEELDRQKPRKGKLVFVGDGINDAPVLARADVGIAMGGLGSDAAIEAADIVLMTDEPSKIGTAIRIAKRTRRIVWQNIYFALGVKAVVLLLGAGGIATMWEAVFADVGVTLIAVLNAMRVMRSK